MAAWRYEISLRVLKKYFTRSLRSLVKYFSTLEEKFRISAWPCNILYVLVISWFLQKEVMKISSVSSVSSHHFLPPKSFSKRNICILASLCTDAPPPPSKKTWGKRLSLLDSFSKGRFRLYTGYVRLCLRLKISTLTCII